MEGEEERAREKEDGPAKTGPWDPTSVYAKYHGLKEKRLTTVVSSSQPVPGRSSGLGFTRSVAFASTLDISPEGGCSVATRRSEKQPNTLRTMATNGIA